MALCSETILFFARHSIASGEEVARATHRPLLECAGESIRCHVILHRRWAVLRAVAHLNSVWREIHVLDAAREHDIVVTSADGLRGLHDGLKT